MAERSAGLEYEYAFSALDWRGGRLDQDWAVSKFMDQARMMLPHLADRNSTGMFLQNGSRLYVDTGAHLEIGTVEFVNPWDACRYSIAGDRILANVAQRLVERESKIHRVVLTRCNVCYTPNKATAWGNHESYGHRADPATMPDRLIPHLVSREIYAGAGGFNNRSCCIEFMLSPRVVHLAEVISGESTHNRGIYHTKNEPLSKHGFNRMHVLCSASLCSVVALWLRTGVTTVLVALAEAGIDCCREIRLRYPLRAMRKFANDTTCTTRVELADGRQLTAIEMQRHILAQIESHAECPLLPPWTPRVCELLREMLDRLENGPSAVAKTLDWAIKLSLYQEFARRRGIAWESLPDWNKLLLRLERPLRQLVGSERQQPLTSRSVLRSPVAEEVAKLHPLADDLNLNLEQVEHVLAFRQELFSLDTQFAELGERGIFAALDRSGALEHQVPGVDNIEHAMENPPAVGRGRLRGECVRRFHGNGERYSCDWMGVWADRGRRYLDLSDPFATEERWKEMSPPEELMRHSPETRRSHYIDELLNRIHHTYEQGQYD